MIPVLVLFPPVLYVCGMRQLLLFFCLASLGQSKDIQVQLLEQWPSGFKMKINHVMSQSVTGGWKMTLKFSKRVGPMQFQNVHQLSAAQGNRVFCLENRQYNADLQAGSRLVIEFIGQKATNNEAAPSATLELHPGRNAKCEAEPLNTTEPPTTTEPSAITEPPATTEAPTTSRPSQSKRLKYNYDLVLHNSILFYEAQRSGKLPNSNRVRWRKDSALNDRGQNGEDLSGGWYDAGDYVKFGFPMAFSVTMLSWGLVEYRDAYKNAGELNYMLDCIQWPLDYFMKAHIKQKEFYGQVGQ